MTFSTARMLVSLMLTTAMVACSQKVTSMAPEEAKKIEELTVNLAPRCVGRYLVDLPDHFMTNSVSISKIGGISIEITEMKRRVFERRLDQRERELRAMHMDGKPAQPFLKRLELAPSVQFGKVFNRADRTGTSDVSRTLELFAWKNGYAIAMAVNATDGTDQIIDPDVIGTPFEASARNAISRFKDINDTPEKLAKLLDMYQRTRGRLDTEIPLEQGVCIANGFVGGPPTDDEWVEINHHLGSARDVYTTFVSMSHIGPEDNTLLERGQALERALGNANGKTLRKGEREANGLRFQEWASERESVQNPGLTIYNMYLEANSEFGNTEKPLVAFELYSGVEKPGPTRSLEEAATREPIAKATLNAAESMALWDKITATIRPRPGAF